MKKLRINAFNEGLIDAYYQKHDLNIANNINTVIDKLQKRYFCELSDLIVRTLSYFQDLCLNDPLFSEFFEKICREHRIVESYLTELTGSFLLLDANANVYCLIVKSKQDLERLHQLAVQHHAPSEIVQKLSSGEAVPFFWHTYGAEGEQWSEWSTYLHPAKHFVGRTTYYYALLKDTRPFDVQSEKILSYNEYLVNHQGESS